MTKYDLVHNIAKETGIHLKDTKIIVDALIENIKETLIERGDDHIEIRGFGTFKTVIRKPRKARNPNNQEIINLPERMVPTFKFSKLLIKKVQENN